MEDVQDVQFPNSCFVRESQGRQDASSDGNMSRLSPLERTLSETTETGGQSAPCALLVPKDFQYKEGDPLWGDVVVGKMLGAGFQARVFELMYKDGTPAGKVLKIAHQDLGHNILNGIFIGMEREWEIGVQLRAGLEEPGGKLPGFMRVCDCIVQPEGEEAKFEGMIMEKINGWEVYKRIEQPEFHNIHYVREMLFQTFSALDRAQRRMGFHHADLGLRNVMEHYPVLWKEIEEADTEECQQAAATGATPPPLQYGVTEGAFPDTVIPMEGPQEDLAPAAAACAPVAPAAPPGADVEQGVVEGGRDGGEGGQPPPPPPAKERCLPCEAAAAGMQQRMEMLQPESRAASLATQAQPKWRRKSTITGPTCPRVAPRAGYSSNADGKRLPLGPQIEFKVIDYGVAAFNETLAQAAGGYEAQETLARIRDLFAARREVPQKEYSSYMPKGAGPMMEMVTGEAIKLPGRVSRSVWHLMPTGKTNRFKVKKTLSSLVPMRSGVVPDNMQPPPSPSSSSHSSAGANGRASSSRPSPSRRSSRQSAATAPRMGPIERVYRKFWQRKGDVFHLLLSLGMVLDDRVWPKQDEKEVNMFISLVHHVTGVKMKASFANPDDVAVKCFGLKEMRRQYGRKQQWFNWFRRTRMLISAHISPYNSGLLAGEALVSPFFGVGRVQAAKLPVCTAAAFPSSLGKHVLSTIPEGRN